MRRSFRKVPCSFLALSDPLVSEALFSLGKEERLGQVIFKLSAGPDMPPKATGGPWRREGEGRVRRKEAGCEGREIQERREVLTQMK